MSLAKRRAGIDSLTARARGRLDFADGPAGLCRLCTFLESELHARQDNAFPKHTRATLLNAVAACRTRIEAGPEETRAHFTMGRLYLLLGRPYDSLASYAGAIYRSMTANAAHWEEFFDEEVAFLNRIQRASCPGHAWVERLLWLGRSVRTGRITPQMKRLADRKKAFVAPVVLVCGESRQGNEEKLLSYRALLEQAFEGFKGTVISGGTTSGIPGLVGALTRKASSRGHGTIRVIGYLPRLLSAPAARDERYTELISTVGTHFSPCESLQCWTDLITSGIKPVGVRLLGIGGGRLSAFEYRLALSLGASVGLVKSTGRAVADLFKEADWGHAPNLLPIPLDPKALRAFVNSGVSRMSATRKDIRRQE